MLGIQQASTLSAVFSYFISKVTLGQIREDGTYEFVYVCV